MPNTRADLERLKHHWKDNHGWRWEVEHIDELLAMCERLLAERTDARDHACKAIATAMGAREVLGLLSNGIKRLLSEAHVIQERDEEQGLVTLSKVVHAGHLEALLNPEGSNEDG